jgi:hypothetical protein
MQACCRRADEAQNRMLYRQTLIDYALSKMANSLAFQDLLLIRHEFRQLIFAKRTRGQEGETALPLDFLLSSRAHCSIRGVVNISAL